jgi:putative ABC transport system ATP-binding protein
MALLKMERITKDYKLGKTVVRALRGLDMEIASGETVAIMGPSGSGKSTLMHILGALDTPTSGTATIGGSDLQRLKESQLVTLRGKKVGFVFQTFNLIQTLSALQNVELPMIFQGVRRSERTRRARELLGNVGLADRVRHKPNELSGGERQRVAVARALANDPEIILADEPTGNLDTESGSAILALLKGLSVNDGKTVILVTHDPEAAEIADRVIRLRDGCVFAEGKAVGEEANASSPAKDAGGRHVDEDAGVFAEGKAVGEEANASSPAKDAGGRHVDEGAKASSSIDFAASEDTGVFAEGKAVGEEANASSPAKDAGGRHVRETADAVSPGANLDSEPLGEEANIFSPPGSAGGGDAVNPNGGDTIA